MNVEEEGEGEDEESTPPLKAWTAKRVNQSKGEHQWEDVCEVIKQKCVIC